jgi:hypothetical protein
MIKNIKTEYIATFVLFAVYLIIVSVMPIDAFRLLASFIAGWQVGAWIYKASIWIADKYDNR